MKFIDFGDIEQIKKIKNSGFRGWANYLIPFCKSYFDADVSAAFIQQELLELYNFNISIHTLRFIRSKYKKNLSEQLSHPNLKHRTTNIPNTEIIIPNVKMVSKNSGKSSSQEKKNQLLEKVIKNMADFDKKSSETRTELDDLIERQQQQILPNS